MEGTDIKKFISSTTSLFLISSLSYMVSDFWLDYCWSLGNFWKIFLTIAGFVLVPTVFFILNNYIEKKIQDSRSDLKNIIYALAIVTIVCLVMALLIHGKLKTC